MSDCKHEQFKADVKVARLEDSGGFVAEITIHCSQCMTAFEFLGLNPGMDTQGASVSIDGREAHLAICPTGTKPNPLQRMGYRIEKIDG